MPRKYSLRSLCPYRLHVFVILIRGSLCGADTPEQDVCLKENLNTSRPSEQPPVTEKKIKTFRLRWNHRLLIQSLFMAFKRVPLCGSNSAVKCWEKAHHCKDACYCEFYLAVGYVFRRLDSRGICEMVSDGGRRFIPAYIVGVHTLSLILSSQITNDRVTEDNHTQETNQERTRNEQVVGTVHKPRLEGIKSVPL